MKKILNYKDYGYLLFLGFFALSIFDFRFALAAVICMIGPIILASLGKGRYWCGNYCPRGNFYNNVMKVLSPMRRSPKLLNGMLFRIFMVLILLINFTLGIINTHGNLYKIGMVFYRLIALTSLIGILLSFIYNNRTWCNFCPIGTLSSLITKFRGKNLSLKVNSSCISCNLCNKVCPMNIKPKDYKGFTIKDSDCILCGQCAHKCPKSSITFKKTNYYIN